MSVCRVPACASYLLVKLLTTQLFNLQANSRLEHAHTTQRQHTHGLTRQRPQTPTPLCANAPTPQVKPRPQVSAQQETGRGTRPPSLFAFPGGEPSALFLSGQRGSLSRASFLTCNPIPTADMTRCTGREEFTRTALICPRSTVPISYHRLLVCRQRKIIVVLSSSCAFKQQLSNNVVTPRGERWPGPLWPLLNPPACLTSRYRPGMLGAPSIQSLHPHLCAHDKAFTAKRDTAGQGPRVYTGARHPRWPSPGAPLHEKTQLGSGPPGHHPPWPRNRQHRRQRGRNNSTVTRLSLNRSQ